MLDISINQLKVGQYATITKICANKKLLTMLTNMGLFIGKRIKIISRNGSILLAIGPLRLGISEKVAKQIFVCPEVKE